MALSEGELALYHERPLVVLPGAELDQVRSEEVGEALPDVYLGTDVYQGEFGVTSFGLVVPRPSQRPVVYYPEEGPVWGFGDGSSDTDDLVYRDPIEKARHVGTAKGFAVVRAVIAPKEIEEGFRTDRYLGPAIIDKCCLEGTVEDLDEETSLAANTSDESIAIDASAELAMGRKGLERYIPVMSRIKERLQESTGAEYTVLREYPSWHSYRVYQQVLDEVSKGCQATVANFDEVISRLASESMNKLHNFEGQAIAAGRIALPAAQDS